MKEGEEPRESMASAEMKEILAGPFSSARELAHRIEVAIRTGILPPGARILDERTMSQKVQLSRTTVRNALMRLERDRLVTRHIGKGTFVADIAIAEGVPESLPALPSPSHLLDFRMVLEPQLAEHLVLRASDKTLDAIHAFVLESRNVENWMDTEYADAEFHRRLYCASGNPFLIESSRMIGIGRQQTAWKHLKERRFNWEQWWRYQEEHEAIIGALRARDSGEAKRLSTQHISGVRQKFLP